MARKKIIAGNWKMNMTPSEAVELVNTLKPLVATEDADVVFCVPAIDIIPVMEAAKGSNIQVGAENMYFEEKGAYTGEISPAMLVDAGVKYVVLGHSERREYDAETSVKCNAKIKALLEANMTPLYCCGESLETFEKGETKSFVETQIREGLEGLSKEDARKVVIAYEPIWAIGTGKNATSAIAEDTIAHIRSVLASMFGEVAEEMRILYGGSVKPNNIAEYMSMKDIDGALVGGASLTLESYKGLIDGLVK